VPFGYCGENGEASERGRVERRLRPPRSRLANGLNPKSDYPLGYRHPLFLNWFRRANPHEVVRGHARNPWRPKRERLALFSGFFHVVSWNPAFPNCFPGMKIHKSIRSSALRRPARGFVPPVAI